MKGCMIALMGLDLIICTQGTGFMDTLLSFEKLSIVGP